MDSLLANYASDDDEEVPAPPQPHKRRLEEEPEQPRGMFNSLPPPKGMFSSLPPPKGTSKGMFSSLPPPKKARVQFRPPIDVSALKEDEDDVKKSKVVEKVVSQVDSLGLPAPKNTGSSLGKVLGGGDRRLGNITQLELYDEHTEHYAPVDGVQYQEQTYVEAGEAEYYYQAPWAENGSYVEGAMGPSNEVPQESEGGQAEEALNTRRSYGAKEFPVENGHTAEDPFARDLKRDKRKGRNEPVTFIQINQDDLTANRPREDQLKMTGIAFGSSYDEKKEELEENKPSRLHKKKHQIGSLYYDMKQKEIDLFERRAQGMLSKAQSRAKYGW